MVQDRERGFTLIEAAVAIAVVAILSGIIVPLVVKNLNDAKNARAKNDTQVIAAAIASQFKDTAHRPRLASGVFATAVWASSDVASLPTTDATGTAVAGIVGAPIVAGVANNAISCFATLFNNTSALGNALFNTAGNNEFKYQGPYMSLDSSTKQDPWGHSYLIFGYNSTGETNGSGIFVVSAGPDGRIGSTNVTAATLAAGVWDTSNSATAGLLASYDDLVARVN